MPRERVRVTEKNPRGKSRPSVSDFALARITRSLDRVAARRAGRDTPNLKTSVPPGAVEWLFAHARETGCGEDMIVMRAIASERDAAEATALRAELESHDLAEWALHSAGPERRRAAQQASRLFDLDRPSSTPDRCSEQDEDRLMKIELLAHLPAETQRERSARDEYLDELHGAYGLVVDARRVGQSAHFVAYLGNSRPYDQHMFMIRDILGLLEHNNLLGLPGARLLRSVYTTRPTITTVKKQDWQEYRDCPERLALLRPRRQSARKDETGPSANN